MQQGKIKVIKDMGLNIISGAIPVIVLQLVILPRLANYYNSDYYGIIVTILALMNTLPSSVGNVLNNVRLLHQNKYDGTTANDFPILLSASEIITAIIVCIASISYLGTQDFWGIVLTVIIGILWLAKEYHIVAFRLKIDYIRAMIDNVFLTVGYIVGYFIFKMTGYWQFIYIVGFAFMYGYLMLKFKIVFEKPKITQSFKRCIFDFGALLIAVILARAISYADKMLLYPILGGTAVSIYYAATVLGKVSSLVITPINSVALTYLAKYQKKQDNIFSWTVKVGIIVCIVCYIITIIISKPLLNFIYPTFEAEAIKYILVTSGSIIVSAFTSMITPFVLKFCDTKWQVVINAITTGVYALISFVLAKYFGLMGFCIGVLIANFIKLIITFLTYYKHSK